MSTYLCAVHVCMCACYLDLLGVPNHWCDSLLGRAGFALTPDSEAALLSLSSPLTRSHAASGCVSGDTRRKKQEYTVGANSSCFMQKAREEEERSGTKGMFRNVVLPIEKLNTRLYCRLFVCVCFMHGASGQREKKAGKNNRNTSGPRAEVALQLVQDSFSFVREEGENKKKTTSENRLISVLSRGGDQPPAVMPAMQSASADFPCP